MNRNEAIEYGQTDIGIEPPDQTATITVWDSAARVRRFSHTGTCEDYDIERHEVSDHEADLVAQGVRVIVVEPTER